jgi:demethylmacrocin O-methyltransferase
MRIPFLGLLPPGAKRVLRRGISPFLSPDLNALATRFGSDKWNGHWYTQHYQEHFWDIRNKELNILEIGVGGFDDPYDGGKSLRMWKEFFLNSRIFGIDIQEKRLPQEARIEIHQGSQVDRPFLERLVREVMGGQLDIVIDDGSHMNAHVIETFEILFPLLSSDGYYVVEDLQTSYWPSFGGDSKNLGNPTTSMNFFKRLTDRLNHVEFADREYVPSYYDKHIVAMHFYHNMVFVRKGLNDEATNREVHQR